MICDHSLVQNTIRAYRGVILLLLSSECKGLLDKIGSNAMGGALEVHDATQFRLILKLLGVFPHAWRHDVVPHLVPVFEGENSMEGRTSVRQIEQPDGFEERTNVLKDFDGYLEESGIAILGAFARVHINFAARATNRISVICVAQCVSII